MRPSIVPLLTARYSPSYPVDSTRWRHYINRRLLFFFFVVYCLKCHQCNYERTIQHCVDRYDEPEECQPYQKSCFLERKAIGRPNGPKYFKMGCGESYSDPAGCQGSRCVEWCKADLCNSQVLAIKYGYKPPEGGEKGGGNVVVRSKSVFCSGLGMFCSGVDSVTAHAQFLWLSLFVLVVFFRKFHLLA